MDTVASGERAEAEIDRFIERQAQKNGAAQAQQDLWKITEKKYRDHKRRQRVAAWFAYFCQQAEAHRKLSESYEARAEALCQEGESSDSRRGYEADASRVLGWHPAPPSPRPYPGKGGVVC